MFASSSRKGRALAVPAALLTALAAVVGVAAAPVQKTRPPLAALAPRGGADTSARTGRFAGNVTAQQENDNRRPNALDDGAHTDEDTPVSIPVLANDSDPDGDAITLQSVPIQPYNGTAEIAGDTVNYTPAEGFTGQDNFTYTISDGRGGEDTAVVRVRVGGPPNSPPDAENDLARLRLNPVFTDLSLITVRVVGNDTDPDGDRLTVVSFTQPASGNVNVASVYRETDTALNYFYHGRPEDFTGDSFTYTVSDGKGGVDTATVHINSVNNPPVAADDRADVAPGRSEISIPVLRNDYDNDTNGSESSGFGLEITDFTQGANGSVSVINNGFEDRLVYTPDPDNFGGSDEFTYTVRDEQGLTDTATVLIEPQNHAPVANDDPISAEFNSSFVERRNHTSVQSGYLFNDYDPDDDPIQIITVSQPQHGTSGIDGSGNIVYTPDTDFVGNDQFTYTISDGRGGYDVGTFGVVVVNPTPVITSISPSSVAEDSSGFTLIVNGESADTPSDFEGFMPESVVRFGTTDLATTYVSPTELRAVVPAALLAEPGTVNVTVFTPQGFNETSNAVPFTITARANAQPDAVDDSASTTAGTPVDIPVLANDTDPDGDALSIQSVTQPAGGATQIVGNAVRYTPGAGFGGTDTFTYTVSDGRGGTDTATVTVQILARSVSAQVSVTRGGFRLVRSTGRYAQTVTLTNTGGSVLAGPISLVLDSLGGAGVTLANRTGDTTAAAPPAGSPYINAAGGLAPGASVSVALEFTNPGNVPVTYTTRVLAGPGAQ